MIILVMIFFVTSIIESSRVISSKTNSQQVSDIALDACFSKYGKELFDDYGILGLWKDKSDVLSDYEDYFDESTGNTKDILGISLMSSQLSNVEYLTDRNGENFAVQVDKLMKYKVTQDLINQILLKVDGLEKNDSVNKVLNEIKKYQDIVTSLDEDVSIVCERITTIREDMKEIPVLIEEMNGYLNDIDNFKGNKRELLRIKGMFEDNYQRLSTYMVEIKDCIDDVYLYEEDYEKYAGYAQKGLDSMNTVLSEVKDECKEEIYNALNTMVNEYDEQIVSIDKDYFNVVHCKEEVYKLEEYCNDIEGLLTDIEKGIKEDNFKLEMNIEIKLPKLDNFIINYDLEGKVGGKSSFLTNMTNLISEGLLSLVVEDVKDISKEKIDTQKVVSKRCNYKTNYKYHNYDSKNEQIRKILYSQYLFDYFTSYLSEKSEQNTINYEIEYVIAGKSNDRENMEYIVAELVAIREGFNFAYIVTDKEKIMAAEGMAAYIAGSTGITPLITVTKWLIVGAWVTAESIVDVRLLLEGEDVSLIKTKSEWNTDLNNLDKFNESQYKNKKKKDSFSLGYEDYLRILLITQNSVKQIYRTMDIIEINIANAYNEKFELSECIYKAGVRSELKIKQLFNLPGFERDVYTLSITSELSY